MSDDPPVFHSPDEVLDPLAKPLKPAVYELEPEAAELMEQSRELSQAVALLRKQGWSVRYADEDSFARCMYEDKTIWLESGDRGDPKAAVQTLSHEAGHALHPPRETDFGLPRDEYVERYLAAHLESEGWATVMNLRVREELLRGRRGRRRDIGVAGEQAEAFIDLFGHFHHEDEAPVLAQMIGAMFARENPGGPPDTYVEQYGERAWNRWNAFHDQPAVPWEPSELRDPFPPDPIYRIIEPAREEMAREPLPDLRDPFPVGAEGDRPPAGPGDLRDPFAPSLPETSRRG
jgi:hypothetical protein